MSPLVSSPSIGYPDYQRLVNFDSGELQSLHKPPSIGNITYGPINVSRWAYMAMRVQVNTGPVNVDIQWSSDISGVNLTGERSFQLSQLITNFANLRMPNLGQYAFVTFASLTGAAWGADGVLYATNRVSGLEFIPVDPLVVDQQAVVIGAGTIVQVYPSDYYSGPAQVFISTGGAGFNLTLQYLNIVGTWELFYATTVAASTNLNIVIITPPGAWRWNVNNTGGVAAAYDLIHLPSVTGAT